MKSAGRGARLKFVIIVAALFMVTSIAFLIAVYRQVQETRMEIRHEFAGWVNISAPIHSPFEYEGPSTLVLGESREPTSPPHVIHVSAWYRVKSVCGEWYDASKLVLQSFLW